MFFPSFWIFFFYCSKACDGHPGRLCDTDGWVRASFPWVKISSPCQTCQLFHTPSHKLKRYVFFFIVDFSVWVSNGCNSSWEERKHWYSHVWHLRSRQDAVRLCSVSGGLLFGWPGSRADAEKWQHLAPAQGICFQLQTLCGLKRFVDEKAISLVCFVFLHSCWLAYFLFWVVYFFSWTYGIWLLRFEAVYRTLEVQNTSYNLYAL